MRRLSVLVLAALLAGCADSSKKGDDATPPPKQQQSTSTPPPAKPQPKPATEEEPSDAVVIKGSKHKDSTTTASSSTDGSRQAKIDELKEKAKASEGKDNGKAYRETTDPSAQTTEQKKDALKAQIADIEAQQKKLSEERASLIHTQKTRRGPNVTVDDESRVKAIDSEQEQLKGKKELLEKKLAALDAPPEDRPPPAK